MEDTLIIISSLKYAYDIRKLVEEKFPELKLKVFIDDENDTQKKDNTKKEGLVDLEDFLKKIGPGEICPDEPPADEPSADKPWPTYPRDIVLMYGCPVTDFHTVTAAEQKLKDINEDAIYPKDANFKY